MTGGPWHVVGVDPGARNTGVVLRVADGLADLGRCEFAVTVHRDDDNRLEVPDDEYLRRVLDAIDSTIARSLGLRRAFPDLPPPTQLIAVEGLHAPSGHAQGRRGHIIDAAALIGTAQVLGAVRAYYKRVRVSVVVVPPGGNGRQIPLNRYPDPLATNGKGHDRRRHERSAYDVAVVGPQLAVQAARLARQEA